MDFLRSFSGGSGDKPTGEENKGGYHHQNPSTTELLASAKLVAEAARSAASNQSDKIDKGKAADLLDAASDKLGDKGVGQYIQKAGDYLHQYEAKNTAGEGDGGRAKPSDQDREAAVDGDEPRPRRPAPLSGFAGGGA